MERFGRFSFDPSTCDFEIDYETYYEPFVAAFGADPERFVRDLADFALPIGGAVVFGAHRYALDVAPDQIHEPAGLKMMDAAIDFVVGQGYDPRRHLNGFETDRYFRRDS